MDIFLHHYPASLFSEKIRLLLGHLGLSWNSVIIPSIMPRPLLMPLSGGYRKTPVLQIGANVYCDTKIIARGLARHTGNQSLYAPGFGAHRVADWADANLFPVTVALNFSPAAVAAMMGSFPPEEAAAFQKDRAQLTEGGSITRFSAEAAAAYLRHYLAELDESLADPGAPYLFGTTPCVADFALYHCLWFVRNNPVNAPLVERHASVMAWMSRMAANGHGSAREASGEMALAAARAAQPVLPELDNLVPEGFALGQTVQVTPVDYGRIPVTGTLVGWSAEEIVLARETPETGAVMTHFPSPGFEVQPA
ncbi:MAG: glutathione S-transferase family protein [Pseudomonadales bacterium]